MIQEELKRKFPFLKIRKNMSHKNPGCLKEKQYECGNDRKDNLKDIENGQLAHQYG